MERTLGGGMPSIVARRVGRPGGGLAGFAGAASTSSVVFAGRSAGTVSLRCDMAFEAARASEKSFNPVVHFSLHALCLAS